MMSSFYVQMSIWDDDLQNVVQMGFGQNQHENFHGEHYLYLRDTYNLIFNNFYIKLYLGCHG